MIKTKKGLRESGLFFIEGKKFIDEIPADWEIVSMLYSESFANKENISAKKGIEILRDSRFNQISGTKTPQGIMAVCEKKTYGRERCFIKKDALLVFAEEINDPGNLGTIIRTARACGANGVFLSAGSADVYNPKVLRASAGSFFHVPVFENENINDFAADCIKNGVALVAAHANGRLYPHEIDLKKSAALVFGNEARGLSEEAIKVADFSVKIPMPGGAESLNVSAACAVFLYEAVRQRL